jgi:glycosyltransferase involved in cell wall biosynthesis
MLPLSVIIPTYNRSDGVLRTLESLCNQTLSRDSFQVIVVDDGSSEDVSLLENVSLPINITYLRKNNEGATIARNFGVQRSQGNILVFIDDDVTVSPKTLEAFVTVFKTERRIITMGTLIQQHLGGTTPFASIMASNDSERLGQNDLGVEDEFVHFTHCNTQLLAVRRNDFLALGMLQDPTGGWPNWDDVDFGYRAHLCGYRLLRTAKAIGEHWDYSLGSLESSSQRWFRASESAARLFRRHPGLRAHIPMYYDKTPIIWKEDKFPLKVKKVARKFLSSRISITILQAIVRVFESHYPEKEILKPLYRWIMGGYMYQGYRSGLRELRNEN